MDGRAYSFVLDGLQGGNKRLWAYVMRMEVHQVHKTQHLAAGNQLKRTLNRRKYSCAYSWRHGNINGEHTQQSARNHARHGVHRYTRPRITLYQACLAVDLSSAILTFVLAPTNKILIPMCICLCWNEDQESRELGSIHLGPLLTYSHARLPLPSPILYFRSRCDSMCSAVYGGRLGHPSVVPPGLGHRRQELLYGQRRPG
jgi:hypothetical protein